MRARSLTEAEAEAEAVWVTLVDAADGDELELVDALVQAIKPAIEKSKNQPGDKLDNAVRANTVLTVEALKANKLLAEIVKKGEVQIVGARYDLDTGALEMIA